MTKEEIEVLIESKLKEAVPKLVCASTKAVINEIKKSKERKL